jgi:hypothetical protein
VDETSSFGFTDMDGDVDLSAAFRVVRIWVENVGSVCDGWDGWAITASVESSASELGDRCWIKVALFGFAILSISVVD